MNEKIGVTTVLGLFGLGVSACYLRSYWGAFDIDVFQFGGVSDFAKLAVYPLAISLSGVAVVLFISHIVLFNVPERIELAVATPRASIFLRVVAIVSLIVAPLPPMLSAKPAAWGLCGLIAVPAIVQFSEMPVLRKRFPRASLRFTIVFLLVFLPLAALMAGARNADRVKRGVLPKVVDRVGVAADLMATSEHPLMLIGYVNDTFVIYETQTQSVALVKQVENAPLVLKPNPKSDDGFHSTFQEF